MLDRMSCYNKIMNPGAIFDYREFIERGTIILQKEKSPGGTIVI